MKLHWRKWYAKDWLSERMIAKTTLAARGLWIEALNVMMANETYKLEGSRQELATLLRCSIGDLNAALPNLQASNAGGVTSDSTGSVTLVCRRLERECIARENGRKRQSKFRVAAGCNASKASVSGSGSGISQNGVEGAGRRGATEAPCPEPEESAFPQLRREIAEYWKRPEGQAWSYEEEWLLCQVCKSPTVVHEWHTIKSFRCKVKEYARQTLLAMLQNWSGELDKARNYEPNPGRETPAADEKF